ncbi:hypothetical protein C1H46_044252 [Malus baccata]|uniref:Uncharacterized protein n=1 Tax=Malus baccata TaxID=106549 RepID=A0A540K7M0_MALBA|nr:hypothetical protein C1H46_044252 [Malus baccata]
MSAVSKKWKTLLNSVPNSHYKIQKEIPSVLCCIMDRYDCKNSVEKRIQLTAWVDKSMGVLCHEHGDHKKSIIECFRLRGILSRLQGYGRAIHGNKEQGQVVDDRIELMAENYVKKLDLNYKIYSLSWYHFPPPTPVGALVAFILCNCALEIPVNSPNDPNLQAQAQECCSWIPPSSLVKVTHLRVVDNPSVMVDYIALIEGLLFCCQLLTLSVTASYPPNINYMIKHVLHKFKCFLGNYIA